MRIYKVTNKITGKMYIGQTVQRLSDRWRDHVRGDKQKEGYLHRAIQKYGVDNFIIEEIDSATTVEGLNTLEEYYILNLSTLAPNGYNLLPGGNNRRLHEDTKSKLSAINKGKLIPNRWDKGFQGKHTEETKARLSEMNKGKAIPNRMNGAPKGRPVSDARRAQISATMTGTPQPWKYKAVIAVETGVIYESVNAVAKAFKINRTIISGLLKSGKQHKKLGLSFKFVNNGPKAG